MSPKTEHKRDIPNRAFPQMPDDTVLWRYTDLSKLVWNLANQALYLVRGDLLGDAFEGSVPKAYHEEQVRTFARLAFEQYAESLPKSSEPKPLGEFEAAERRRYRAYRIAYLRAVHVSCWRHGDESEAMWRLYCGPKDGVALVTTWAKLKASLTDPATRLGKVRYINYRCDPLPSSNALEPITHKRRAFSHEQEVRVVRWLKRETTVAQNPDAPTDRPEGIPMPWDAQAALDQLVVSPYAPAWYQDVVRFVVDKLAPALSDRVLWSELREDPVF